MRLFLPLLFVLLTTMSVQGQTVVFTEDFENPPGNVFSSGSPGWFINSRLQTNGINSDSATIDIAGSTSYLETNSFTTVGQFFVTLNFNSICKIEFFDAGTIEISIDGGMSWEQLIDNDMNPGGNNNCNYLGSGLFRTQGSKFQEASYGNWAPGSATVPDNSWWQAESFDISLLAGNMPDVKLRFKLDDGNNSGGAGRVGWFIDNLEVIAAPCELIDPVITAVTTMPTTVYNLGPYTINADVTDNSGLNTVTLYYSVNGPPMIPVVMTNVTGNTYSGTIPAATAGDIICYYIEAVDGSGCNNTTLHPGPAPTNTICFTAEDGISFPYCDNFDFAGIPWTGSGTAGTIWELGAPAFGTTTGAHSPPNAWDLNLTSAYTNSTIAALVSPEFFFTVGAGATLEFWQNRSVENTWDGTRLEWATNINGPWTTLGAVGAPNSVNWYNAVTITSSGQPGWTGTSNGWEKSSIKLDAQFNNQPQVWFRFVFTSDGSVTGDGMSIDDFCISLAEPNDVGVSAVVQPGSTAPAGNCVDVILTLTNYGTNTQTNFPVAYSINGGAPVSGTFNGTLTPGGTANITLPCFVVPTGLFSICAWTELTGDANNFNDTSCANGVVGIPVLLLTTCDDFESGNNGFQTTTTNAAAGQWQLGTPAFGATTGAFSGTNAWDINLTTGYGANANATLATPIYDLATAVNPYLSFYRNQSTATGDGLRISYNVNGSGVWNTLGTVGDPDGFNWYNTGSLNAGAPGWSGNTNGWVQSKYFLQNLITATAATFIQFRFDFVSGFNGAPAVGVSIDDLCVVQPGADDVGVTAIIQPGAVSSAGNCTDVIVRVRNFGTNTQTNFPVVASLNGGPSVTANYTGSLAPGATALVTLPCVIIPSGTFSICAWTDAVPDIDHSNDTICSNATGIPTIPVSFSQQYFDDFNGANVGWTANPSTGATVWQLGAPTFGTTNSSYSAPNCWDVNLTTAYGNNANCELVSPLFDFTNAVDAELSFWRNNRTETGWDGTRLEYSVNGGPWTLLGGPNLTAPCWIDWYNSTPTIISSGQPAWMNVSGGWVKTEAKCLGFLNNIGVVQFRFIFTSDGSVTLDGVSIDDFRIHIPIPLSAAPITVNTNAINNNFIFPGQPVQISSPISNPGTTPLNTVDVTLTVNGVPIVTDPMTFSPALQSTQSLLHTFSQLWTATPGVHQICVITSNPNNGLDQNPFDDTTCITISVFDTITVTSGNPYCTDFETGPQWISVNAFTYNNSMNSFQLGSPAQTLINGAHSGVNAWMTNLSANYPNVDTSGLFTPVFTVDNTKCYKLSFWHYFDTDPWADGGIVEYSTDFAQTWGHLGFQSFTNPNWYNAPFVTGLGGAPGVPGFSGLNSGWILAEQEVNFWNSGPVMFRFRFGSDNTVTGEGWAIDDFCFEEITTPCTVSIPEIAGNTASLAQNSPNPFNNLSTIEYFIPTKGHVKISLVNVLGQEMGTVVNKIQNSGSHTFTVNSKDFGPGIYYYTLEFENQKFIRKMIVTQ